MSLPVYRLAWRTFGKVLMTVVISLAMAYHANAQCYAPVSVSQDWPSGTLCAPQNVSLKAHYYWDGQYDVPGEFRWYLTQTDPNPVQVDYVSTGDFMDSYYWFQATN